VKQDLLLAALVDRRIMPTLFCDAAIAKSTVMCQHRIFMIVHTVFIQCLGLFLAASKNPNSC
jgi:hypothetical protein